MRKTGGSPHLTVIEPGLTGFEPPRPLGEHGQALWNQVMAEYAVEDIAGREFLCQAGQALDLAEALAAQIKADGVTVRTPSGFKSHPSIKEELTARGFVVRTLAKLGLNFEPLRAAPGRPPGR
jgi:hypothetical protein